MSSRFLVCLAFATASLSSIAQVLIDTNGVQYGTPQVLSGCTAQVQNGQGLVLTFPNNIASFRLVLPATDWTSNTHLQVTVQNTGTTTQPIFFALDSGSYTQWLYCEVVLPANGTKTVIIPLDRPELRGLWAFPQPLNNSGYQAWSGGLCVKSSINRLFIDARNENGTATILLRDVRPVNSPPASSSFVDQYGQQNISFPGRVTSDSQLTVAGDSQLNGKFPFKADAYGGAFAAGSLRNPDRWMTKKAYGRWQILTPLGNPFFSAGAVSVMNEAPALVTGRESSFMPGIFPNPGDPLYDHMWHYLQTDGSYVYAYSFYTANLQRRFGTNWKALAVDNTLKRMRAWGFNTVSVASDPDLQNSTYKLPHASIAKIVGSYARLHDDFSNTDLPDVFDPAWVAAANTCVGQALAPLLGDSYSMGLYVDNELPWAKAWFENNARYATIESLFKSQPSQPAKLRFQTWLQARYGSSIASLNTAWGTSYATWNDFLASQPLPTSINSAMAQDFQDFDLLIARTYFSTVRQAITSTGYKGLYLGCRLLYFTPEVLQASKEYCDVLSFNSYDMVASMYRDSIKSLDMPVLISEFGFGACDLGRANFYPNLLTENDRLEEVNRYLTEAHTWTNLVGMHWYQWSDDVISGIYPDGRNYSLGLVSLTDIPYTSITNAFQTSNVQFAKQITGR